ncbi:MAG: riboflavin synthase [Ferruginibacter sp.]|nr:riboflavin synthase [Ferruginibacter sp.]
MFTGIIEDIGQVMSMERKGSNISFWIQSTLAKQLKVDQSLSHNGVCLTVEQVAADTHKVTAIAETLKKTNLVKLVIGDMVNLERCMQMNGRLDGHIVQGHVDDIAICVNVIEKSGSWEYTFSFDPKYAALIIEKGSVCVNGISLTAFNVGRDCFTVAIIPYTYNNTGIKNIAVNSFVNVEWDVVGKYILKNIQLGRIT